MNKQIGTATMALALVALWPAPPLDAADPHVFRFQAEWRVNAGEVIDCDSTHSVLSIVGNQADVDTVDLTYQFNLQPCNPNSPLTIVQAVGTVDIRGNLARLSVDGIISTRDDREVDIDLNLRKIANLPDPGPGEKAVSASARGTIILDGVDLTGGLPSTSGQITRSTN